MHCMSIPCLPAELLRPPGVQVCAVEAASTTGAGPMVRTGSGEVIGARHAVVIATEAPAAQACGRRQ